MSKVCDLKKIGNCDELGSSNKVRPRFYCCKKNRNLKDVKCETNFLPDRSRLIPETVSAGFFCFRLTGPSSSDDDDDDDEADDEDDDDSFGSRLILAGGSLLGLVSLD